MGYGRNCPSFLTFCKAKFEVCAHKFVDLSEFGYGVALLNDCKYGFSVKGSTISMSILRAPKAPDDSCDIGRHTFRYALQPHSGSFLESEVVRNGYEFNCPLIVTPGSASSNIGSFITVDKSNIVVDTIKQSEDGKSLVIRCYESYGGRGQVLVKSAFPIASGWISNILEECEKKLDISEDKKSFILPYTPFKLITVRLDLQ